MSLAPGARFGPYEILCGIGAGVASDPERTTDSGSEARAASALHHPHIGVLHDFGLATLRRVAGRQSLRTRRRSGTERARDG
jgi:hypothetical protein